MKILYIEDTADKYAAVTKNYWNLLIRLKKQLVIS